MSHLDRLSTLIGHVDIRAARAPRTESTLAIWEKPTPWLVLARGPSGLAKVPDAARLPVRLDFGGDSNPLFHALPDPIQIDLAHDPGLLGIAHLIQSEAAAPRCGGEFALSRLCEVLLVKILRNQIEQSRAETGVLAGLAHPKLSRVLVAMHDQPGHMWRVEDFLPIAGMSRSQFMSAFQEVIGTTPMAYLKTWRMGLARAAVLNGDRINAVATRLGYQSSDAFSRAFVAAHGVAPTRLRDSVI